MDLFGPTSVRSINHASYCLVITDDCSRFCWVFFLAKKDETSGILKTFIRQIENQLNQKVKIIRSDNGTEVQDNPLKPKVKLKVVKDQECSEGVQRNLKFMNEDQVRGGVYCLQGSTREPRTTPAITTNTTSCHYDCWSTTLQYAMTWTDEPEKEDDRQVTARGADKKLEDQFDVFMRSLIKIEKYVGGLPDMIHRSVMASRPKPMQDAIEMATELMDKKISTLAEYQAENKRKLDNNNQAQQQSPKRQNVAQAYCWKKQVNWSIGQRTAKEELDSAYERFQHILACLKYMMLQCPIEELANLKFLRSLTISVLKFSSPNIVPFCPQSQGQYFETKYWLNRQQIPKGYTQAASSKVPTAPNYTSHSDEIICSFFSQQASMPTTHDDEDLLQIDEDAMEEINIRTCASLDKIDLVDFDWSNKDDDTPVSLALLLQTPEGSRETRPVWNNIQRVNHSNFSRNSRYPHQRRSFIPSAVLTRDGLISTARPKMTQTVPSKSTDNVTYQGTARSRVPQAALSQSTDGSYYPRMDNRRPRISSYSPLSRSSNPRTTYRQQRPKKTVKSIWVKKGSTVGSHAVLPQTVKKSAMINPKQTWRPKGNYLDSVNRDNGSYTLKQFDTGSMTGTDNKEILNLSPKFKFVDERIFNSRAPRKNEVYSLDLKKLFLCENHLFGCKGNRRISFLWHNDWGMSTSKISTSLVKGNLVKGFTSKTLSLITPVSCRKGKTAQGILQED
ncbi:reverse transcriptase domain-containing protein [Tanacetum coccineum]